MARALPTGVVTFLFTDIEGSTKLWERCPKAMREALAEHDEILRAATERNGGVVFKTVGDAFCCAFEHPRNALAGAIDGQRTLHEHAWPSEIGEIRVRMGIHSGECSERDGDYFGPTVNRVARLMSIGYGEQILVSAATAALVQESLEADVGLRDLGPIRLKDLSQPERTYQVLAAGLRAVFPKLLSVDSRPNNLPSQISSFVGREREIEELGALISRTRLLTIAGPGGIGKTRLALALAANVVEQYEDGAWFVDLTGIRNADFIAQAVANALGLRELPNEPIETTLTAHLSDRRLLLVTDNSEHLLAGVARFVKTILPKSPAVTVLTTSREPLHVAGEQVYRLGPLEASAGLFLERAREAAPSMTFGDEDYADVAALCSKLEGIPLAIELTCARLSSIPLKQLARRLKSGLTLTSKDSTESSRHRTLRETIAWSYQLLAPREQAVLAAFSVFRGGCTAEAVEAVAGGDVADVDEAAESLVDKSLLQLDDSGAEPRYRLLDVVREFAHEQLEAAAARESVQRRHAEYYAELAATAHAGPPSAAFAAYRALDADAPNVRAALEWRLARDLAGAVRLVVALAPYWRTRGSVSEARTWIARALDAVAGRDADRATLLCLAASFATLQDELAESLRFSGEALDLCRTHGDRLGAAQANFRIAEARHRQGALDEAEALYRETRSEFAASGDARTEMLCVGNLGMLARQRGDLRLAMELLDEAMQHAAGLGEERISGEFAMAMGWVQLDLDDLARSRQLFERAFDEKRRADDRYGLCCAHHGLATVALKEGRQNEALAEFVATLQSATELQLKDYVARAFHGIAAIEARDGDAELAARLLGLADRLFDESGRTLRDSIAYDLASKAIEEALPGSQRSLLREEGARMRVNDAIDALRAVDARVRQPT